MIRYARHHMIVHRIADFLSGNLTRRTLLFVSLPLIWFFYFGTLAIVGWLSPEGYDWRRKATSKLLYPRNNPEFHSVASVGIALAGLLMIPFAGYIRRRLRYVSPITTDIGAFAFGAGAICLSLAALIVSHPYPGNATFPRLHEIPARSCAFALGAGMLVLWMCALKAYLIAPEGKTLWTGRLLVPWSLLTLPTIPISLLRMVAHSKLGWPSPIFRALKDPRIWQLGLWEWIGSWAVFLFLFSSVLLLPELPNRS